MPTGMTRSPPATGQGADHDRGAMRLVRPIRAVRRGLRLVRRAVLAQCDRVLGGNWSCQWSAIIGARRSPLRKRMRFESIDMGGGLAAFAGDRPAVAHIRRRALALLAGTRVPRWSGIAILAWFV